ncbi:hypothetical protein OH687_28700 [Burkholderia anthina]|nr:hypothetical protein OH687_28700 [Burkholderia anthina]
MISVACRGDAAAEAVDGFDGKRMPSRTRAARPCATQKKAPERVGGAWVPARSRYRALRLWATTIKQAVFMPNGS